MFAQARLSPVSLDGFEKFVVLEQTPQTAAMVGESVVAAVDIADNKSDQLPLHLAKGLRARPWAAGPGL